MRRALTLALAAALATSAPARAEPSDARLVGIGAGLALPDYLLGVSIHEGSHALAAELAGASVDELHLFPPGVDPHVHTFRFGWTYVHGLRTRRARALFYIAPKLTDALLVGAYAALTYTAAWPSNRYASLALTVFGTGLWVDFTKDVVLFGKTNDIAQFFRVTCIHGVRRELPARLLYAAASVGLGLVIYRGYQHTFDASPAPTTGARAALTLPIWTHLF